MQLYFRYKATAIQQKGLIKVKNQIRYLDLAEILVLNKVKAKINKRTKIEVTRLVNKKDKMNNFISATPSYFPLLSKFLSSSNSSSENVLDEKRLFTNPPIE